MNVKIQGKQMDVGTAFQTHITDSLEERVGKYFDRAVDATVILSKESYFVCAEITVHPGQQGLSIQAKASAAEPYPAFDAALDKIAKRLRRYRTRLKDHHGQTHAEAAELQNAPGPQSLSLLHTEVHVLPVHSPLWHWSLAVQPPARGRVGAHVPPLQNSAVLHSPSLLQPVVQWRAMHSPPWHWSALPQGAFSGCRATH